MGAIAELFHLNFEFNGYTFILIIIYLISLIGGYFIMGKQVKLIKKEIWDSADRLKSMIFGFFFANSVIIIISIMITFLINEINPNDPEQGTALFILFPLLFNLIFISVYPLADLIYMASGEPAMTPLQKPFKILLNLISKPYSYILAVLIYSLIILIPLVLLTLVFKIDFMIAWISWGLLYPMMILTYYGVLGFIIAFAMTLSKIPSMERSTFLTYDSSERAKKEFLRDPLSRILFGLLVFVYVFQFYAFIRNFIRLNPDFWSEPDPHFFDIFNWMIYLSLGISITVYFSRFWGRKIKFKTMDLLFAAFLIAAVGINVLNTYTVSFYYQFESIYTQFSPTAVYYDLYATNLNGFEVGKYCQFTLASNIEELILIIGITYFLFLEKNRKYWKEILYGQITQSLEVFNPIPAFNMIRKDDKKLRKYAKNALFEMYDRIPIKKGYDLKDPVIIDPLFDAISDPTNIYSQEVGKEIIGNLMENYPNKILSSIKNAIHSCNFDKSFPIMEVILERGKKIIVLLDPVIFYDFLDHSDYRIRKISIKLLNKYYHEKSLDSSDITPTQGQIDFLVEHLNNPDYNIQADILIILSYYPKMVSQEVFSSRLDHHVSQIRSIAAKAASSINLEDLSEVTIPKLIKMMDTVNPEIKAAVFTALTNIGHFNENKIPLDPFMNGLLDRNNLIRSASLKGVLMFLKEKPYCIKADYILSIIDSQHIEIQKSLLRVLGALWKQSFIKIFPKLIEFIHSDNSDLQQLSQNILVNMGSQDPKLVVSKLIIERDTESIIQRGKISATIIKIAKINYNRIIPIMIDKLSSDQEHIRINCASVLSNISEKNPENIPLEKIIEQWSKETKIKVTKELTKCISNIIQGNPDKFKTYIPEIVETFTKSDSTVRLIIAKIFVDIGEKNPELISFEVINKFINDDDPYIREIGMKVLGTVGNIYPKRAIPIILEGLKDPDWNVKNAATKAFNSIGKGIESDEIVHEIKKLLNSENKWTRRSALEMIIKIAEKNPSVISLTETFNLIHQPELDDIYLYNASKLLGIIGNQNFEKAFPEMLALLQNPSKKVRDGMVIGMAKLSNFIDIDVLVPKLLFYLSDETDMILQQSVALVLKRIMKYESGEIKQRVLSILSIRAGVSQDAILLSVLSDLQE